MIEENNYPFAIITTILATFIATTIFIAGPYGQYSRNQAVECMNKVHDVEFCKKN